MLPETLQRKGRKEPLAKDTIDPYELVRRLSIIQAEEALKELNHNRTDWETELAESRDDRQVHVRTRTKSTPNVQSYKQHKHSAAISLAPDQLSPPAYTHLPEVARRQSHPITNRTNHAISPRRPSLKRGDSGDLETINENGAVEPTMTFPKWTESQRRRPSALPRVDEDCAPEAVSIQPRARRRSSLAAKKEQRRQDWSQSDESSRAGSRRSSWLDRFEQYWKLGHVDAGSSSDPFDSKASTLRNPSRSSEGGSTSSRRPSILRKIGNSWVVSPPSADEKPNFKDIHTDEDDSVVDSPIAKKRASLFSKLRH